MTKRQQSGTQWDVTDEAAQRFVDRQLERSLETPEEVVSRVVETALESSPRRHRQIAASFLIVLAIGAAAIVAGLGARSGVRQQAVAATVEAERSEITILSVGGTLAVSGPSGSAIIQLSSDSSPEEASGSILLMRGVKR